MRILKINENIMCHAHDAELIGEAIVTIFLKDVRENLLSIKLIHL